MSLFPAYSEKNDGSFSENSKNTPAESWLKNDSFIGFGKVNLEEKNIHELPNKLNIPYDEESESSNSSSSDSEQVAEPSSSKISSSFSTKKRSHSPDHDRDKRHKHQSKKTDSVVDNLNLKLENLGFIDLDPAPKDSIIKKSRSHFNQSKKKLIKKFQKGRYYCKNNLDLGECLDDSETKNKTEMYNIQTRENPYDINLWLEFIKFQDVLIREPRPRSEKKMSILEKAMEFNPNSCPLTEEMFNIMETYCTADMIQAEAKKLIMKDKKNIIAWQWMIRSSMYNITKLSVPKVLDMFSLALDSVFRAFPNNSQPLLDILLQCCTFLRQSGLWENLWMLVELCLELNLSVPGSNAFHVSTSINEDSIRKMEDEIVVSGLPLGSLWLRLEYLRTCYHYLPINKSSSSGNTDLDDPQRVVFTSDVASLLHPVHAIQNSRLIVILLSSLKVPLIPMSDCGVKYIGLDKFSWSIESPEFLLAALGHPYLIKEGDKSCLSICKEVLVSPQYYVTDRPGSEEFFHSIDSLFDKIIKSFNNDNVARDLFALWRMRWYTLLGNRTKQAMNLLKLFPQNIPLYIEFALLSYSSGDNAMSLKVLEKTLKQATATFSSTPILHLPKERDKQYLAYLHKTYIELLIKMDLKQNRNKILKLLIKLSTGETVDDIAVNTPTKLAKVKQRFESVSKEMLIDIKANSTLRTSLNDDLNESSCSFEDIMIVPFQVSWFSCYSWFLYIIDSSLSAQKYMESVCNELKSTYNSNKLTRDSVILEGCYETLVTLVHISGKSALSDYHSKLKNSLQEAVTLFPNNLFFLHIASSIDVLTGRWWSVSSIFLNDNSSLFAKLFTVFVYRQKMYQYQSQLSEDERIACGKKLYSLVRRVIGDNDNSDRDIKRCPLLWRLLLQFVEAQHPQEVKSSFYRALDLCPWVKSIYYDGGKMLPEELSQIQDLIVEKELRIHITSDEIEILREDTAGSAPLSNT